MPTNEPSSKLVSIGLPTYNRPDCLRRVLDLLISQTYQNIQIVVSDNASPDNRVGQILKEFASKDSRVKCHRQERNIGLLANTDFVLEKSTGEYFAWISDDDWRSPDFVTELVSLLEENVDADMAFCDYHAVYEGGELAKGYPATILGLFKPFRSRYRIVRTLSHYWQDASQGKSNLFYSVFRRAQLKRLDLMKLSGKYVHLNMDNLIAFSMLQLSPVLLSPKVMCTLTCGNTKHYLPERFTDGKAGMAYLLKVYEMWQEHKKDALLYISNTSSFAEKAAIALLFLPRFMFFLLKVLSRKLLSLRDRNVQL